MAEAIEKQLGPVDICTAMRSGYAAIRGLFRAGRGVRSRHLARDHGGQSRRCLSGGAGDRRPHGKRGRGSIIQTASIYGVSGRTSASTKARNILAVRFNTPPVYSASKAGVIGLTRHLAAYWGPAAYA